MDFAMIQKALNEYYEVAREEYSVFEEERHKHFVFDGVDGSHPKAINYWLEELKEYVGARKTDDQLFEFGSLILLRATSELRAFFESLEVLDKKNFIQGLVKLEAKLLKLDQARSDNYFSHGEVFDLGSSYSAKHEVISEIIQPKKKAVEKIITIAADESTIKAIKAKEMITVEEFTVLYEVSKRTQATWRARSKDKNPLPCVQLSKNGTIKYKVSELERWFENERR
jgi:hypothetical protein